MKGRENGAFRDLIKRRRFVGAQGRALKIEEFPKFVRRNAEFVEGRKHALLFSVNPLVFETSALVC